MQFLLQQSGRLAHTSTYSEMQSLVQLVYISTIVGETFDKIENFVSDAKARNYLTGISGLILISNTHYIHYIEGGRHAVSAKFLEMSRKTHHKDLVLVRFNEINKREFPEVLATYSNVNDFDDTEFNTLFTDKTLNPDEITSTKILTLLRRVALNHRAMDSV